jgi:hypothetical protein
VDTVSWVAISFAVMSLAVVGVRTWIKSFIERSVSSRFEREIEAVRSDLRIKEAKITALQSTVLSGRASRHALFEKRRLEALEGLWAETIKLDQFRAAASMVAVLKLDVLDKKVVTDPNVRKLLSGFAGSDIASKLSQVGGEGFRPFVPPFAWKVFDAYKNLLLYCYIRLNILATGIGETEKFFDSAKMISAIKDVMPHFSDYLDKFGVSGAAHLVDPLREMVFQTVAASLEAEDADEKSLADVVKMMEQLDQSLADNLQAED